MTKQKKKETAPSKPTSKVDPVEAILAGGRKKDVRGLFAFDSSNSNEEVLFKFAIWARWFYPKFFKAKDAPFHEDIDLYNLQVYRGQVRSFTDIVFRGGAKTTRTKLFVAYVITNDLERKRKYFKVLTKDLGNAKRDLPGIVAGVVEPLREQRLQQARTFENWRQRQLTDMELDHAIMELYRAGVINVTRIADVIEAYTNPPFDWGDPSAWRLFNATTYALTGKVAENPQSTTQLHQVIDGFFHEVPLLQ